MITMDVTNKRPMTLGQVREIVDRGLLKNPNIAVYRKARILAEVRRQYDVNPLNINVQDGDFQFSIGPDGQVRQPVDTSKDQILIKMNVVPEDFRFVGSAETVKLDGDEKFATMTRNEMEKLLGRPVNVDDNCVPTDLTKQDCKIIGATMAVREALLNVKTPEERLALMTTIREGLDRGDAIEAVVESMMQVKTAGDQALNLINSLPPKQRRDAIKKLKRDQHRRRLHDQREMKQLRAEIDRLELFDIARGEIIIWSEGDLVVQAPPEPLFHQMRQAILGGRAFVAAAVADKTIKNDHFEEMFDQAEVFVVEHDWAAVVDGATITGSEGAALEQIKLPADVCAFEFRVSGRHVIVVSFEVDDRWFLQPIIQSTEGWLVPPNVYRRDDAGWVVASGSVDESRDSLGPLVKLLGSQIRAVAISLDAQVAVSEVVRAPYRSNQPAEHRGRLPTYSYHVVSLARRSRAARLEREDDATPGTRRRLHFRRGHWRHYEQHKTWIHWMLVGDPDLGFVDKHYKL